MLRRIGLYLHMAQQYAPELIGLLTAPLPTFEMLRDVLGPLEVSAVPVPARCEDGFLLSFWDRPERVLDAGARAATSAFASVPAAAQDRMCAALDKDLRDGTWAARNGHLRTLPERDVGLKLVVAVTCPFEAPDRFEPNSRCR